MSRFLEALQERVLLCDGGMGSRVQAIDLDIETDYRGAENCTEVLNLSRPDLVLDIHKGYIAAGSDIIQTNSFGGSPITLDEFDLGDQAHEINRLAGEIARKAIDATAGDGRERFVLGSIGPGTRLPSLGHIDYDSLEDAYHTQAAGLIAGDVDALLVETCQDTLQIKAAVNGAKRARADAGIELPIMVQVTVETTGTLLVGADIAAAATVVEALGVDMLGLNCATGPQEMAEHVKWLGENWPKPISLQPNAGLPELVDGAPYYPLGASEMADWLRRFVSEDGVNLIGGCCGTDIPHIEALDAMLREAAEDGYRPAPLSRTVEWTPALASAYGAVSYRQENAILSIGERCNANGSKKFRELQEAENWDACVEMGRDQVREGSHAIDVCTALVGRDEISEMNEVVRRMRGSVNAPLVIDSTEFPVLESAMRLYGGKPLINSINFEDGEEAADMRLRLARTFGAGVIALTIDEDGMAKTADEKLRIAKRLYDFAVGTHGLPPSDLLFDPLTFTICTGNADDRLLGVHTLDAIEMIAKEMPECQIILGLSNISFGLNAAARHVLNSVFLDHAVRRGMTGAILHVSKIMPLHAIPEREREVAEDLIFDRSRDGYDPLTEFLGLFEGRTATKDVEKERPENVEERLSQRIIDGDKQGLEDDLSEAMESHPPLDIINTFLLDGMKVVGELFGAGKMQLPFVLKSAETMKAAVAFLEPHMERVEGQHKGTIVLATVKGDVHDIGKNLVDIILTNNGYNVVNLGIKQPINEILSAAEEHAAQAIGLSGLLVKSTVVMRENLNEMTRAGLKIPVILGGAALTRAYVEEDCVQAYACGRVAYARDAFDGLGLMDKVVNDKFDTHLQAVSEKRSNRPTNRKKALGRAKTTVAPDPVVSAEKRRALVTEDAPPTPPFWGPRIIARVPVPALLPYLNERMLYQFQWGYRKDGRSLTEYMEWAKGELRPILKRMTDVAIQQDILIPQAAYGYWKAAGDGDDLVLFDEGGATEVARFPLPRQAEGDGKCIADYVLDASHGPDRRDVVALQVVTMGQHASDTAREWFGEDRYQDYLYLHGLGVEMAEAMAEYTHKRIRAELGFTAEESRDFEKLLQQEYRGSRYSFGYPACPKVEDQSMILDLLGADRIGIELSDEFQLHPEQSTSAIVILHPKAKYFSV
ncbi:MAG: methionine synthase [Alphaproteobacteria bacterium]|nr:methionine synthase [Alphaproteobacteria bacterium]